MRKAPLTGSAISMATIKSIRKTWPKYIWADTDGPFCVVFDCTMRIQRYSTALEANTAMRDKCGFGCCDNGRNSVHHALEITELQQQAGISRGYRRMVDAA